jgi:organic hydroperoxide reductase OsmC/OhrA
MARHSATVSWRYEGGDFLRGTYSRAHHWTFDGGVTVPASAAPSVVPAPWSDAAGVDPEEAFVAALASCHLLSFLHVARLAGVRVSAYRDTAEGRLTKGSDGRWWVSRVVLAPRIVYGEGGSPSPEAEAALHARAHAECFIANSVKTEVVIVRPDDATAP